MLQIAGGIILAIVILFLVFHCLARLVYWKQQRDEAKANKRKEWEERKRTEEWLEALEKWDERAKKWKDAYFEHKAFEIWPLRSDRYYWELEKNKKSD